MEMLEKIYRIIEESNKPLTVKQIAKKLKTRNLKKVRLALKDLILQGKVFEKKRGHYYSVKKAGFVVGEIERKPAGFAFLLVADGPDIFIPPNLVNGAVTGDIALVKPIRKTESGRIIGKVIGFVQRKVHFVGNYEDGYVIPDDKSLADRIKVLKKSIKKFGKRLENDVKVLFKLIRKGKRMRAEILEILGKKTDPDTDIKVVIKTHELPEEFPPKVLAEAEALPDEVVVSKKRLDLRDRLIYTIDPITAKDFDDAISVEKTDTGYILGVHIADVGFYVQWDTALDREARNRGTSVYLLNTVIPMLPHRISSYLASLKPNVDRYAFSVFMEMDRNGNLVSYKFARSVIRSKGRLAYEDAQSILEGGNVVTEVAEFAGEEEKRAIMENLKLALELAQKIRARRMEKGSLDFDLPEAEFVFDEEGNVIDIYPKERLDAHRLIEDFMISANVAVARFFSEKNLPTIYRVHDRPKKDRMERFVRIASGLLNIPMSLPEDITPLEIARILERVKGTKHEKLMTYLLLRSMARARYSIENKGHFGLALEHYLHFTSPIRRYPDLVVHRLLASALRKRPKKSEDWLLKLDTIANHSTLREEKADSAQWDIWDLKKIDFIQHHIGEQFEGVITGIVQEGVFVELIENLVEGFVPAKGLRMDADGITALDADGNRYRMGDRVVAKVLEADKDEKRVIFSIEKFLET